MDHRLRLPLFYLGIAALVFTCEPVRASDDTSLLTQLLRKANVVLDNIIAKQTVLDKSKQDVELELIERNEENEVQQQKELFQRNEEGNMPPLHRLDREVSEPEPAPKSVESSNSAVGDLSLEKVLKYLQYLRSNSKTKRSRE